MRSQLYHNDATRYGTVALDMQIMAASGDLHPVRTRQNPLLGSQPAQRYSPLGMSVNIVGELNDASFTRIYKENPWVNAAIRSLSWGVSRLHLGVYELQADGQRQRARWDLPGKPGRNSAAVDLDRKINGRSPNGWGPQKRMRRTMTDYLIYGNALWNFQPEGIYFIPWRKLQVHQNSAGDIDAFEVISTGGSAGFGATPAQQRAYGLGNGRYLMPEDCVHFCAGDDPDGPLGVPPMASLRATLALHEALRRHLVRFFENSARPSGNLQVEGTPNKDMLSFMREQFNELYSSPENAGKVIVTTGNFQPITAAADQSQIIELAKQSRDEIAGAFRIPGPVLGAMEHAIKANVKELREQMVRDVIGSWSPAIEDDFMAQAVWPNPTLKSTFVEFDLDEQLTPGLEGIGTAFTTLERTMTTNERRRKMNLPDLPFPEADTVPSVPGGGYLGIEPDPAMEPADGVPSDPSTGSGGGGGGEPTSNPVDNNTTPPPKAQPALPEKKKKNPTDGDGDGLVNEPR